MSFSFIRTASRVRKPLTYFSALAAMSLSASMVMADDDKAVTPQVSALNQVFAAEEKFEFSPVPALKNRLDDLARSQNLRSAEASALAKARQAAQPSIHGSVDDFFGKLNQPAPKRSVSAKMFIPDAKSKAADPPNIPDFTSNSKASIARFSGSDGAQVPHSSPARQNKLSQYSGETLATFDQRKTAAQANLFQGNSFQGNSFQSNDFQPSVASQRRTHIQPRVNQEIATTVKLPQSPAARVAKAPVVAQPVVKKFPASASVAPGFLSGTHQLRNIDMNRFEKSVVQIWGKRIKTSTTDDGRFVRVELPNNLNNRMTMIVDRQTDTLSYDGNDRLKDNWHQIVEKIDSLPQRLVDGTVRETRLIDGSANPQAVRQVAFLTGRPQAAQGTQGVQLPAGSLPAETLGAFAPQEIPAGTQGIKNTVRIIQDPETGILQLVGDPEDMAIIRKIILDIDKKAQAVQPQVERIELDNLQSEAIAEQVQSLYDTSSYPSSNGPVQITPLASPNSLVVVGQKGAIEAVKKIVESMDVSVTTDETGGFKAIRLKYISAADAALRLNAYFGQAETGNGANSLPSDPVTVVPDFRSNTVVVKGSAELIRQAQQFIKTIDIIDENAAVNEVKVIPLSNTVAADMAVVIQDAINGQQQNSGDGANPNFQGQLNQNQNVQTDPNTSTLRSALLSLRTTGAAGEEIVGGIMFDVRVTADSNSNSLIVTGPKESLPLIEALVKQLDRLPNAETLIKVFEIVNGDAQTLLDMLEALFGVDQNAQNQGGTNLNQLPLQGAASSDGQTLVNLRFSVDLRTNTIIASGPAGDLQVVEDLLNRLDTRAANQAPAQVYRLSNAPAVDVAEAINAWLEGLVDLSGTDPRINNGVSSSDRAVIVVPEVVSNSLIVSARDDVRAEVEQIIRALDRRPPLVKVKVLIAEVDLTTLEEFGVEVGLQDSLLFDRGTLFDAAGDITDGIGFPFNTAAAPNANANSRGSLAGQAISNLGTGRINSDLGFGGLVLSAGSESVNILLRALKDRQCVRVLSKPHIMTLENLQGRIAIGANVPRVAGTTQDGTGNVTQDITFVDVGVILEVTPRVSPDGMIVMAVNASKSAVGPDATGITIGFGAGGEPIIAPQLIQTEAQTTLMARSGQTVVFSGLIQEEKTHIERGAPILSDLPVIGPLFKFESDEAIRSELLFIMTPYLVTDDGDIEAANNDEIDRLHWCECDVAEIYGNTQYGGYQGEAGAIQTFYPDADPTGSNPVNFQQQQDGFIEQVLPPGFEAIPQAKQKPKRDSSVRRASYSAEGTAR